uniref:histone-lysine N-methyltransferase SETDB1-like isoform X3 n=1 Tax=Ciona intestinalis TaxID=7719 RepID=UPI0005212FFC|nr:histone-lysine N-methyltransferase SETDB1-like isoform X3 [Ciona intestinalis]|eukprot:XP_009859807.1 histone-lysine N-methyltransferase SETDB1-like isoform X3 [Ciona intestinalis]
MEDQHDFESFVTGFKSKFNVGFDLDEMFHSVVREGLDNLGYDLNLDDTFEDSHKILDNVITGLPKVQSILNNIDQDLSVLESETKIFDRQLMKLMSPDPEIIDVDAEDEREVFNFSASNPKVGRPATSMPNISVIHSTSSKAGTSSAATTLVSGKTTKEEQPVKAATSVPINGTLGEDCLSVGMRVLAFCKEEWKEAVIIDILTNKGRAKYKVRFLSKRKTFLLISHLACVDTFDTFGNLAIPAGSRVAANYKTEGIYSGVVAEASDRKVNRNRYLIFFDDGYAMYCNPRHVYLVYGPQTNVWIYISHKPTSDYIRDYLSTPERPILTLKEGQSLKVEFEGEWHKARCMKVDCSLVEVLYLSDNSKEWIYRGSLRLEPLFRQVHGSQIKSEKQANPNRIARAHTGMRRSHIEYAIIDLTRDASPPDETRNVKPESRIEKKKSIEKSWEAPWNRSREPRKLSDHRTPPTRLPMSYTEMRGDVDVASRLEQTLNQLEGKLQVEGRDRGDRSRSSEPTMHYAGKVRASRKSSDDTRRQKSPLVVPDDCIERDISNRVVTRQSALYVTHKCNEFCVLPFKTQESKLHGINPLMKPLVMGWTREIKHTKQIKYRSAYHVCYRAPCGKTCRNMADVMRYILECRINELDIDHFCFNYKVRTQTDPLPNHDHKYYSADYSKGKEDIPISCVNEITNEPPPKMPYTKVRVPGKGVKINTSSNFMVCCDCPDNCRDRSKCPCQQLTVQATTCCRGSKIKSDAGYKNKRLFSFLPTGVYECNPKCKCNMQCRNRLVQKGLQCRLQLFKTHKKGWGVRCLDDIPQGSFVCIYTGKIQTEENANQEGLLNGDEYLAELDHIEVAENEKAEYNDDASSGFNSGSDQNPYSSDDEFYSTKDLKDSDFPASSEAVGPNKEPGECVRVTLKRDNSSTWQIYPDNKPDEQATDKKLVKNAKPMFSGTRKKLGYSINVSTPPSVLTEEVRRRRAKQMVPRHNVANVSADWKSGTGMQILNLNDEDTTDTDSDNPDIMNSSIRKVPTARKSTGGSKTMRVVPSVLQNEESNSDSDEDKQVVNPTRRMFGNDGVFIIDAKQTGNLGRYLNHSCSPNLMVQNVFIDTHDLRFPWVAFFTNSMVRAGTELTWDYNYEIGSVSGRVIYCYCGSTKCRKRLL